jgi:putative Mg2+ transporter-C (MgtC) family protein
VVEATATGADTTRIIQGIVTGIGFLGAGVIMKDGLNISGLTTAASLWASSAIGILVGIGFYASAILLTVLSAACMLWLSKVEGWLPSHPALSVSIRFRPGFVPSEALIKHRAKTQGYAIVDGSLTITSSDGRMEWHFVAIEMGRGKMGRGEPLARIAGELDAFEGVESFQLSHARN